MQYSAHVLPPVCVVQRCCVSGTIECRGGAGACAGTGFGDLGPVGAIPLPCVTQGSRIFSAKQDGRFLSTVVNHACLRTRWRPGILNLRPKGAVPLPGIAERCVSSIRITIATEQDNTI